jgi:hypothetical protein
MKILTLPIKKHWYDMILSGEKPFEYREIKEHWISRFIKSKEEMEWQCFDEMCNDLKVPSDNYSNLDDLLSFFDCRLVSFDAVKFVNGYSKKSPSFLIEFKGIEIGKPISGLCEECWLYTNVFIIKLGKIIKNNS